MAEFPTPLNPLLVEALIDDTSVIHGIPLATALAAYRRCADGPHGEVLGALTVTASSVEELRPLADPEGRLPIAIVADQGLLALQEARSTIQDDVWLELSHVGIALPAGFSPAESTSALLAELAFTVPTYVDLPRTGFEVALDVLADDGAERVSYACGVSDGGPGEVPNPGELASLVHACVSRRITFALTHVEHAVHTLDGTRHRHGLLNVLAATACALSGGSTDDVADLLATTDLEVVHGVIESVTARRLRDVFSGVATSDPAALIAELAAIGVLGPEA